MDEITGYAVLRDGRKWEGVSTANLEPAADGALTLARLPAPAEGQSIDLPGPYESEPSGLAVGRCGDLYIADTRGNRVIWIDAQCETRMHVPTSDDGAPVGAAPGHFDRPRGVLLHPEEDLFVADSGNGRLQLLRIPTLEAHAIWDGALDEPACLAGDSLGRVYALLRGSGQVIRFSRRGVPDAAYNAAMAAHTELAAPAFLAVDAGDVLYVSDAAADEVLRFDPTGAALGSLPPGGAASPTQPRALLAAQERLFVADAASGEIWAYDLTAERYIGALPGYRGPVSALAAGPDGSLYVKPGLDEGYYHLEAGAGFAASGELLAGPLDAGIGAGWARLRVDSETPAGTHVDLQTFTSQDPIPPAESDWAPAPALDLQLPPLPGSMPAKYFPPRYLWLRLRLSSADQATSPRLLQIQAETRGEDYMDYLPALYRRRDGENGFLRRWLALYRSELGDLELELEDMPRRFDPLITPENHLAWLSGWLALALPHGWEVTEQRALLAEVYQLYKRRGTLPGVAAFVEMYSGARPHIFEAFRGRRLWVLGESSTLGFETGLAPAFPDGMILPDETGGDTCRVRLSGSQEGETESDESTPDDTQGWSDPEGLVVGQVVVGQGGPQAAADLGESLFNETAHRFTVLVPAAQVPQESHRQALVAALEAEKPAHTDYHLCFVEARMRVGFQARLGVDTIVAGPPDPMELGETSLGYVSSLGFAEGEEGISRAGQQARLGKNLVIR